MHYDFRIQNSDGRWESKGHRKGADRVAALRSLHEAGVRFPAGRYMSRPRGRQKDWDLFSVDADGRVVSIPHSSPGSVSPEVPRPTPWSPGTTKPELGGRAPGS